MYAYCVYCSSYDVSGLCCMCLLLAVVFVTVLRERSGRARADLKGGTRRGGATFRFDLCIYIYIYT